MRLNKYIQDNNFPYLSSLLYLTKNDIVNEHIIPDNLFNLLKKIGEKIGINVKRSDTIFDYIEKAQSNLVDLFTYATLYFLSKNPKQKEQLKKDMADVLKNVNVKEITAFLMQLDRATIGLTAHVRHILMSLFGIEIATYNKIHTDIELIQKELQKIRMLLSKIKAEPKILSAFDNFEFLLMSIKEDGVPMGPSTMTDDIATFDKRLTGMVRRKFKKKNRKGILSQEIIRGGTNVYFRKN